MTNLSPGFPFRSARWRALALLLFVALFGGLRAGEPAPALNIDVRSEVDQRWHGVHKDGAIEHGKIYALAAINEVPSAEKLVKPVRKARLVELLRAELAARGFTEITAGQRPDVVLTVLYGRGWLRNPYLKGAMLDEVSDSVPTSTILLPDQALRQREFGFESKVQDAQQEKLFIRVTAWKYPETPQEKPADLWKTTMVVDDPANRDMNLVLREMLAAGGAYFDRQIDAEEIRINSGTPEGRVILGPMKIIETDVKKK